jgi:hypothetical protein
MGLATIRPLGFFYLPNTFNVPIIISFVGMGLDPIRSLGFLH